MRVLHFYRTYLPDNIGGAERSIYHLCRAGAQLGIENRVLTLTERSGVDARINLPGHDVERVESRFKVASVELSMKAIKRFRELAAEADVVHFHFPWPMGDIAQLAVRHGKPSVVTYHADIQRQKHMLKLYRPLMHRFLGSVDRIVATSPKYIASSEVLRRYHDKVQVVPLGLTRSYYPTPDETVVRKWKERIGTPFFLFVGVFRYYKGLPVLLEAMRRSGYPVVFVGDGPLGKDIRAQAQRLGLANAHFTGSIPDVDKMALIQLCEAIVFPSPNRAEAFGMSLLEGAMMGKPMISCEIGTGTSYVNVHGETGLVVAPNDPDELAQAMHALWRNPEARADMGRRAALRFEDLFTAQGTALAYRRIYETLLDTRPDGVRHPEPERDAQSEAPVIAAAARAGVTTENPSWI